MQIHLTVENNHARRTIEFGCRILVFDVDLEQADRVVLLLERIGHQVTRAYRAASAIELAKEFRPDIVLVDLTRRPILGLAATVAIRSIGRPVHMVAVTTPGSLEQQLALRRANFDAQLVKPVDRQTLEQMLEHWCGEMRKKRGGEDSKI